MVRCNEHTRRKVAGPTCRADPTDHHNHPLSSEDDPMSALQPDLFHPDRSALLSACGTWRYRLERVFGDGPTAVFVGLNPSTADAVTDDPTIRRLRGFWQREGWGRLVVVNLFAWRSPSPDALVASERAGVDVVGPENDAHLQRAFGEVPPERLIVGWGATPIATTRRRWLERRLPVGARCLGLTKAGWPRHPLYLAADTPFETWTVGG